MPLHSIRARITGVVTPVEDVKQRILAKIDTRRAVHEHKRGPRAASSLTAGNLVGRQVRCAIYTRKSTEEGLDQAFNSLDAQREACAAYVVSQRHEGWTLLPDLYDDGGFSGGTMERPALKRLLMDVESGRVDVIVVYKVDRLTRALSDFAKIVEILDGHGASFVSVTQAFNTTTSMGRLTLNVLLSFAQFEREVTGERIRDKIAASKKKGMWMGGPIPLGYDVKDRRLIINEGEAETVRLIFAQHHALGSLQRLAADLAARGVCSKLRTTRDGRITGGKAYTAGALGYLLRNRLYIGQIRHGDQVYAGEHEAILDQARWDAAQTLLERSAPIPRMTPPPQRMEETVQQPELALREERVERWLVPVPSVLQRLLSATFLIPEQLNEPRMGIVQITGDGDPTNCLELPVAKLFEVFWHSG